MSDDELRYRVMFQQGTEPPFSGKHLGEKRPGKFKCAECGKILFLSENKFESSCGWPSFDRPVGTDAVKERKDFSHFMVRTEITCPECGGHLGHVFNDGPTETGLRYCINSVALDFEPEQK